MPEAIGSLCVHSDEDARVLTYEQLREEKVPERTGSYVPVPHSRMAELVRQCLSKAGATVSQEKHVVTREGKRYFGLMEVSTIDKDWTAICGLRNSHDKRISAGLVVGSRVFVCDNLAFTGDVQLSRRHVGYILHDLPVMVAEATLNWMKKTKRLNHRWSTYKGTKMLDRADTVLVRALLGDAMPLAMLNDARNEIQRPRFNDFADETAWSVFNNITTVMRDRHLKGEMPVDQLHKRTRMLTNIMDQMTAYNN